MDINRMLEIANESGVIVKPSDNPVHKVFRKTRLYKVLCLKQINKTEKE